MLFFPCCDLMHSVSVSLKINFKTPFKNRHTHMSKQATNTPIIIKIQPICTALKEGFTISIVNMLVCMLKDLWVIMTVSLGTYLSNVTLMKELKCPVISGVQRYSGPHQTDPTSRKRIKIWPLTNLTNSCWKMKMLLEHLLFFQGPSYSRRTQTGGRATSFVWVINNTVSTLVFGFSCQTCGSTSGSVTDNVR